MKNIADIRKNYAKDALNESDVAQNPIDQFKKWFDEAIQAKLPEPNAMTVATVDAEGQPSARIVLIKGVDERGFSFFTNYLSQKGQELAATPKAALLFHWVELERQVRIQGLVEKLPETESDTYFNSRPLDSRIGAWASEQSQVISGRSVLVGRAAQFAAKFALQPPRPPHWGGYVVKPNRIEFWQGRPSRLHDRIVYQKETNGNWQLVRLAP